MTDKKQKPDDNAFELTAESNLYQRILYVRQQVRRLGKDAQVSGFGAGYKAITHDKVTAEIRPLMCDAGIVHTVTCITAEDMTTGTSTKAGRPVLQHRALFQITFTNAFDPKDQLTVQQWAYADDFGDKAPGKALSYGTKYALLKMFMIETGEDDEVRTEPETRPTKIGDDKEMSTALYTVADELFGDDASVMLQTMAQRKFNVDTYNDIPADRYTDAIHALRRKRESMNDE